METSFWTPLKRNSIHLILIENVPFLFVEAASEIHKHEFYD